MKGWKYPLFTVVRVNEKASKDMSDSEGLYGVVVDQLNTGIFDYLIELEGNRPNGKFKEKELDYFLKDDDIVEVIHSGEKGKVITINFKYKQVELEHIDRSTHVYNFSQVKSSDEKEYVVGELVEGDNVNDNIADVEINDFEHIGQIVGRLVDKKQIAYGDSVSKVSEIMRVLLQKYKNEDNTYTIPDELLDHMLLTVRELDKINRYFTNPKGDLMEENPYQDKVGYNLLGMRMYEKLRKEAKLTNAIR